MKKFLLIFINEGTGYRNQLLFSLNDGLQTMRFNNLVATESMIKEDQSFLDRKANKITQVEENILEVATALELSSLTFEEKAEKETALDQKQNELRWRTNSLALESHIGNNGLGNLKLGDSSSSGLFGDVDVNFFDKANGVRQNSGEQEFWRSLRGRGLRQCRWPTAS